MTAGELRQLPVGARVYFHALELPVYVSRNTPLRCGRVPVRVAARGQRYLVWPEQLRREDDGRQTAMVGG